ncbi:MAG: amidohydrolase [Planctomycetota bacterium]|nr:amidohydrolase [Planctomycetota bacterium]
MTQIDPTNSQSIKNSSKPPLDEALFADLARHIDDHHEKLITLRRHLHATPDASGHEHETTAFIAATLTKLGCEPRIMQDGLGLLVDIDLGAPSGSFIALRSELDAVGVNDDKQTPYASSKPGLCHACGHDVHSTILMGVAGTITDSLDAIRQRNLKHNLRLIFQPSEETATGAQSMIMQGALDSVAAILCLHVDPFLEPGRIGVRHGPITASCNSFRVHIKGRGGHTARPFEAIDPIPAVTSLIDQFYMLCPRSVDARHPMVISVASIDTGSVFNAIPDEAVIQGTLRTLRTKDASDVQQRMLAIAQGVALATGCDVDVQFEHACPPTNNDVRLTDFVTSHCKRAFSDSFVEWIELPSMGGEDFAFYQEQVPGLMVRLGAALPDQKRRRPLHSSHFDIDESALTAGTKYLVHAALWCAEQYESDPT